MKHKLLLFLGLIGAFAPMLSVLPNTNFTVRADSSKQVADFQCNIDRANAAGPGGSEGNFNYDDCVRSYVGGNITSEIIEDYCRANYSYPPQDTLDCMSETSLDVLGSNSAQRVVAADLCKDVEPAGNTVFQSCIDDVLEGGISLDEIEKYCEGVEGGQQRDDCATGVKSTLDQSSTGVIITPTPGDVDGDNILNTATPERNILVCSGNKAPDPKTGRCVESTCTDPTSADSCEIFGTIGSILNGMALLVIPLIVLMIVFGGIQYSMSNGNPSGVASAKDRIYKALFALASFIFLWSFLQWLIPGGLI